MAPNINNPGGVKNDPDEIRDGVVSDSTRFAGGFIDQRITQAGAAVQISGGFKVDNATSILSFDVSPQDTGLTGATLRPDGSQMFVTGESNDRVYQYDLSTPFDVSTASLIRSLDVSPQDRQPEGVEFKPDGSIMYILGSDNVNVYQYNLSTDYDISTASFSQSFDVSTEDSQPKGIALKPDGTEVYTTGSLNDNVYQYSLSTPFDISTESFTGSFNVGPQSSLPAGITFDSDGGRMYVAGENNAFIFQYELSTDFDVTTSSFDKSFDVSSQDIEPTAVAFGPDGQHMYVSANRSDSVYQYGVGTVVKKLG